MTVGYFELYKDARPALTDYVENYRRRAGIKSGLVPVGGRAPVEEVAGDEAPGS